MAELTSIERDELKRLQADAARYHFVRDVTDFNTWETLASLIPDEWDDYVDAAMLAAQGNSYDDICVGSAIAGNGCMKCSACKAELAEPATHSEDGLPMQVTDGGRNPLYEGLFDGETEQNRLERIMAAKDAEIARLDAGWHEANKRALEASLAQPARQVVDDEDDYMPPGILEAAMYGDIVDTVEIAKAALAQAAKDGE